MKLNNKGFMMAEVVTVSAIILIFLTTVYVSYNSLYSTYKSRINYYDVNTLYALSYYRDILVDNNLIEGAMDKSKQNKYQLIYKSNSDEEATINTDLDDPAIDIENYNDTIFMIYNNKNNLSGNELTDEDINVTYQDYLKYLSTSADLTNEDTKTDYVMVIERCQVANIDECKYAYLEVYSGEE